MCSSDLRELLRFHEELAVTTQARAAGIAHGLLPAQATVSPALRNGVLHEAFEDLQRGDAAAVAAKLSFLREHVHAAWRDPYVRVFRALSRLGAPGRGLLALARALAVRLAAGRG